MTAPRTKRGNLHRMHDMKVGATLCYIDRVYIQVSIIADRLAGFHGKVGGIDPRMKRALLLAVCGHHGAGLIMPRPHGR
jgi:hypothetical protein